MQASKRKSPPAEKRVSLNARIPERLDRELALYVARHRVKKQDAVAEALRTFLGKEPTPQEPKRRVEFPLIPSRGGPKIRVFTGEEIDEMLFGE
ncbi:MAG: hypothetical protein SFV18_08725 [Bryobacteraceae bacterium]|nr:hypothetical protein [Bryobacteraceae bacterium]